MKKLKTWQLVLLIIFYPVGIIYFIVWLCNRNKQPAYIPPVSTAPAPANVMHIDTSRLTVLEDFYSKVAGVTFNNNDGTSRQNIIKSCKVGDDIVLKPVPTKEYPDAIGVFNNREQQLGHLKAELAADIKNKYGYNPMSISISDITGGGGKSYGCNLHIIIYAKQ